uniref:Methylmalonic aciduria (Cobalamin deficiency) cblD type, with homocystinuria n=2 Tax=Nothobranchius TaxID=28779 RepID=A0A1A8V163_NOTFU|nr:metabolism of cobalamin associated Db [Nothobranchius furzeri]XP_054603164.1 metabolism of cobalamin associated Db [Nothobranchius furzeri]
MSCVSQVLGNRTRLVKYLPGIHVLAQSLTGTRAVSAESSCSHQPRGGITPVSLGLDHFGNLTGLGDSNCSLKAAEEEKKHLVSQTMMDLQSSLSSKEGHPLKLVQFTGELSEKEDPAFSHDFRLTEQLFDSSTVECAIQSCPESLKKDFCSMFPEAPSSDMMVITVAHKTQNDMSAWSPDVEQEREQMLDQFVHAAKEICSALQRDGFWADFIDPSSGLAFFGAYTNNTLFETDDRYSRLGFHVDDLGCCRVIRHSLWGTRVFVGTICTNAPPSSPIMKKLQYI